ncbi:MAG: thermonuclease family protein [candidate division KSB1 bacterium]|nr:thermonuclease family protein [candidate division KSB1 bacterium]
MEDRLYYYRAQVVDVFDGDTCTVDFDLGLYATLRKQTLRLARIDAPEVRGPERDAGVRARDALRGLILGKQVIVRTFKDRKGKYGRWIAEIWLKQPDGRYLNVNDWMLAQGFATPYRP